MKLINYIPDVLKDYFEIIAICNSEDIEINQIKENIDMMEKETIVKTASIYGIERYERIYNLTPNQGDSYQIRKDKIIQKITNRLPFSLRWLINKLNNLVGKGNYILDINYARYDLLINISGITTKQLTDLQEEMKFMLPVNLVIDIRIQDATSEKIYFGGWVHRGVITKIGMKEG